LNEVYTPPSRYGSLGLVSIPSLRRSNAITREEEEAFNNRGYIGAQMMHDDYPDPFDSPPRVRINNLNNIPGGT
jgi:hypothetical protein